jgi:hypothetical protein
MITLIMSLGTTIFSAGILYADVRDHERRIVIVESKNEVVLERLTRMESNLDFLVDQYRQDRRRDHVSGGVR